MFVPKGFPIGFEMAEKNLNKQTDRHFRIYISRDDDLLITLFYFTHDVHSQHQRFFPLDLQW